MELSEISELREEGKGLWFFIKLNLYGLFNLIVKESQGMKLLYSPCVQWINNVNSLFPFIHII